MKKNTLSWQPCYFDRYIDQVPDVDLSEALRQSLNDLDTLDLAKIRALGLSVYAPGKWTLNDLFQHLIDCERVFAYRAMRFARNDKTLLPGFDEDVFAENAGASRRSIDDLLAELRAVRMASILMFESFDETALRRTGMAYNAELPVLALGFVLVGHQIHHFRVMEERYFPMLQTA